jgi:tripartite-type tricarboxylate transporter receptor subunit TctC
MRPARVTSPKRLAVSREVPSIAELLPSYDAVGWQGFFLPTGTLIEIVGRFDTELVKILKSQEVQRRLTDLSLQVVGNSVV